MTERCSDFAKSIFRGCERMSFALSKDVFCEPKSIELRAESTLLATLEMIK